MTMPNFIVVGAQKSGTTTLHHMLAQHPQILMSRRKEPRFFCYADQPPHFNGPGAARFNRGAVTRLTDYQALFGAVTDEIAIGESSTDYSTGRQVARTAETMWHYIPNARILAILRHPADRAYSAFNFARHMAWEPLSDFVQAMAAEELQARANWPPHRCYFQNGCYYTQLKPYFDRFPRTQIRVYLFDEWRDDPAATMRDMCRFLGVDETFPFDHSIRRNETWENRNALLHALFEQPNRVSILLSQHLPKSLIGMWTTVWGRLYRKKPPRLDPALRQQLTFRYQDEIVRLQDLLDRDLTHWLEPPTKHPHKAIDPADPA